MNEEGWAAKACESLRQHLYARLKLPHREAALVRELYAAIGDAFDCNRSRRQMRIPDRECAWGAIRTGPPLKPTRPSTRLQRRVPSRSHVPLPRAAVDNLDERNGFVSDPNREWLELHPATPTDYDYAITAPHAEHALAASTEFARFCRGAPPGVPRLCRLGSARRSRSPRRRPI